MSGDSPTTIERLLTVEEVADLTRTSTDHIYRLVRQHKLGAVRVGRRVLVHPIDLDEFIRAGRTLS